MREGETSIEGAGAEGCLRGPELAKGAEEEEEGCVGGGSVNGDGDVGDLDRGGGAGVDIDWVRRASAGPGRARRGGNVL